MAPSGDPPCHLPACRISAAAGVTGIKGPSPPSAIRHQTRLCRAGMQFQSPGRRDRCRAGACESAMRASRPGRCPRIHQVAAHEPWQHRRQPEVKDRQLHAGPAKVPRMPKRRANSAGSGRSQAATQRFPNPGTVPHAPQVAPNMPSRLIGDRLAGAAEDRRHQGRTARRVVAWHDAEFNALDWAFLQRLLDNGAGDGRRGADAGTDQHARLQRRVGAAVQCRARRQRRRTNRDSARRGGCRVRRRRGPVFGKWTSSVDSDVVVPFAQHAVQLPSATRRPSPATPKVVRASTAARSRAAIVSAILRIADQQAAQPAAEDAGTAENEDAHAPLAQTGPGTRYRRRRRLGVGAAAVTTTLVIERSDSAISVALTTMAMPFRTGASSMTNGLSRANSSIGRPPAGMMTSAPSRSAA